MLKRYVRPIRTCGNPLSLPALSSSHSRLPGRLPRETSPRYSATSTSPTRCWPMATLRRRRADSGSLSAPPHSCPRDRAQAGLSAGEPPCIRRVVPVLEEILIPEVHWRQSKISFQGPSGFVWTPARGHESAAFEQIPSNEVRTPRVGEPGLGAHAEPRSDTNQRSG